MFKKWFIGGQLWNAPTCFHPGSVSKEEVTINITTWIIQQEILAKINMMREIAITFISNKDNNYS